MKAQRIIFDGSNVSHNGLKSPRIENLILTINYLKSMSFNPIVLISAKLIYLIDDRPRLNDLVSKSEILVCPAGINDDLFLLNISERYNAPIITNDQFKDH